jgi:predicted RNase H-like HicB family nuclease
MDKMIYRIIVEKGEDFGYVVHCPAIPGCHSQGATIEEAVKNIQDAIKGCLSAMDKELIVPAERVGAMEVEV